MQGRAARFFLDGAGIAEGQRQIVQAVFGDERGMGEVAPAPLGIE